MLIECAELLSKYQRYTTKNPLMDNVKIVIKYLKLLDGGLNEYCCFFNSSL